jgi:hypothetical protein
MDIGSIAGTAVMMQAAQTRDSISTSLLKMAGDQQQKMADLLAQNVQTGSQAAAGQDNITFSIRA